MLGPHVWYFGNFDLLGQFTIPIPNSEYFLIEGLQLYLLLFYVVLRVVDAKVVAINISLDFWDLLELLEHCVSDIQFSV